MFHNLRWFSVNSAKFQRCKCNDESFWWPSEYPTNHILFENKMMLWGTDSGGGPARWALASIKTWTCTAGNCCLMLKCSKTWRMMSYSETMSQSSPQWYRIVSKQQLACIINSLLWSQILQNEIKPAHISWVTLNFGWICIIISLICAITSSCITSITYANMNKLLLQ